MRFSIKIIFNVATIASIGLSESVAFASENSSREPTDVEWTSLDSPASFRDEMELSEGLFEGRTKSITQPSKSSQGFGAERAPVRFQAYWMPSRGLSDQSASWTQFGEQLRLAAPVKIAPDASNMWLATAMVDHISIDTDAILPDSGLDVPSDLWKVQAGFMNIRQLEDGWKTVAIFTAGSASDRPFANARDTTLTAIGSLEVPYRNRDAWNFSVYYSPTSQLPFPLPGVAYVWRPNDKLEANLGIPFSLRYQPVEPLLVTARYFPLTNVDVLAALRMNADWTLYGGYRVTNDTYWLAERTDEEELFYLFDQRLTVGLQRNLVGGFSLDISAGYLFDRQAFQGEGFRDNQRDEINIDAGVFGAAQLIWSR